MKTPLERRASVFEAAAAVNFLTICAMVCAALTVVAVSVVAIFAPDEGGTIIPVILGIMTPLTMALLSAGLKSFATVTNGQMGQIIYAQQEKSAAKVEAAHAQGVVQGALVVGPEIAETASSKRNGEK